MGGLSRRSPVTRGMGELIVLVVYQSEETMMNASISMNVETYKAIEGKERQWLRDVAPPYFPQV